MGQSYSNLGKFDRATFHLDRTLILLRQPLPTAEPSLKGGKKVKGKKAKVPSVKDAAQAEDVVKTLNSLAKVCCPDELFLHFFSSSLLVP